MDMTGYCLFIAAMPVRIVLFPSTFKFDATNPFGRTLVHPISQPPFICSQMMEDYPFCIKSVLVRVVIHHVPSTSKARSVSAAFRMLAVVGDGRGMESGSGRKGWTL